MNSRLREGYCKETVYSPGGSMGGFQCSRKATGDDGLCGLHRAGKRRSEAKRAEWDAKWEEERRQYRITRERERFTEAWRAGHLGLTWGDTWTCPLCARVIQAYYADESASGLVDVHQNEHGQDWLDYIAIGADDGRPRATGA